MEPTTGNIHYPIRTGTIASLLIVVGVSSSTTSTRRHNTYIPQALSARRCSSRMCPDYFRAGEGT